MTTVPGIDVSYWQSNVNWTKVRRDGQRFAFIKATEGDAYTDPTFGNNWAGAKSVGILRAAYCFFHPAKDASAQVTRFLNTLRAQDDFGELPPIIDLEVTDNVGRNKIISGTKSWLDQVERAVGRKPMIYSGVFFLESNFSEGNGYPPAWTADYPFWLGWYPNRYRPGMDPLMPKGWTKWNFWQYSDKGNIDGINNKVNLNLFNGSEADLQAFASGQSSGSSGSSGSGSSGGSTTGSYTVLSGDTFESIAAKFGITLAALLNANPQLPQAGSVLAIPGSSGSSGSGSTGTPQRKYTVKPGDTLTAIAAKYGTTVAAIVAANNIPNPDLIQVGQVLIIP